MFQDKSILAVIPARAGSKRIPQKNLYEVEGKSLLKITVEQALKSSFIDRVVVSTEDHLIATEARAAGADVPFVRPLELASDTTPGIEPILHAISQLPEYDYVILLQVTSPLRTVNDINEGIQHCFFMKAASCVAVKEVREHPAWMYTISNENRLSAFWPNTFTRKQDLPAMYIVNGAFYMCSVNHIRQAKRLITEETVAYCMPEERSLDIDTDFDLRLLKLYKNC